ncbi:AsmA family protein [Noviherbaspirillum sedimenti]|uniref:AsmA family protein n=1 Tax=Noviherbaspirillum sedimenti TaxID=2320865 RepID=A0A3A3G548_9BURK|nr:AsmA family protein [Noviherbaspirillum sedimenti]RJG02805.1 AsmA family protein [Noviherbaspirillum sedimenti]
MPKALKFVAILLAALLALVAIAAAIFAATFNPNDYKPQLIRLVAEKKQRTLAIPGDIKLSFFPKLGAQLGQVSLSEHKGSAEFASFNQARVSLALMPLLRRQLVVDQVSIDGAQVRIRRNADGSTNFDDLLAQEPGKEEPQPEEPPAAEQFGFDISGIDIRNTQVSFDDLQAKRQVELANLNLETGKIANGVPSQLTLSADVKSSAPAVAARVAVKSGFTIDLGQKHYLLHGMDSEIKGKLLDFTDALVRFSGDADLQPDAKRFALEGVKFAASGKRGAQAIELRMETPKLALTDKEASGGKLSGEAKLVEGLRNISAKFSAPSFEGSPQAFRLPAVALDVAIKEGKLDATAKLAGNISGDIDKLLFQSPQLKLALAGRQGDTAIDGNLTTPLSANLKTRRIDLPSIVAAFALPNPGGGSLKLNAAGNASVDLAKSSLSTALKGKLDESSFDARFGMAPFSPAAYTFAIDIDRINADRYLGKGGASAPASAPAKATGKPAGKAAGAGAPASQGIDLSALRELRARGTLNVGALTLHNLKASKLRATLHAGDGKLEISPLAANLYGGNASGSVSATASKAPRFALKQNLTGIDVGPLLKDAIDKQPIEGRGNVTLDVTSAGGGFDQIKRSLNGSARLELRDGAVHGVNVAQAIRKAKAKIGELRGQQAADAGTGSVAEKTDFSELSGSFRISNGVAHNDDLSLKSPLIRLGGAGDIDLGAERLDYLAKVTVVSTLQGQGGPELQALKGLTIPVRLSGPFTAIGWRIDFAGLAKEAAKEKIQEKKTEIKEKAREKLEEKLKGLFGK